MSAGILDDAAEPAVAEDDLVRTRQRLGELLIELSRRRHDLADVPRQVRLQLVPLATGGVILAGVTVIAVMVWKRRRARRHLGERAFRLRRALGRMVAHPERVAEQRTLGQHLLIAAASALVGLVVRRAGEATLVRGLQARRRAEEPSASQGRPVRPVGPVSLSSFLRPSTSR